MGLESAEMVKHTINTFLATCVTFIDEVASICERVGANAGEVEAGIRSEPRIGPHAYVTPGGAFGGSYWRATWPSSRGSPPRPAPSR